MQDAEIARTNSIGFCALILPELVPSITMLASAERNLVKTTGFEFPKGSVTVRLLTLY
jgi:hypothetical protein